MKRLAALCFVLPCLAFAQDLDQAPKSFTYNGKLSVPVDFQTVHLLLEFDPATQRATGRCEIEFFAKEEGYPLFDLVPTIQSVTLNGKDLGNTGATVIPAPNNETKLRRLSDSVPAGSTNKLVVTYTMNTTQVAFSGKGIRMVWAMSDLGTDRTFLEKYACSNLEFDHFALTARVEIAGTPDKHQVFTNGDLQLIRPGAWRIDFPEYFTTSSPYLHISNRLFEVERIDYAGLEKTFPILVYGTSASRVASGMTVAKRVVKELESTYGPFAHASLTAYIGESEDGGGMEHVGATITSVGALDHEITHSWFARGVMPANGASGWIDEAIASWRDDGYPRRSPTLSGPAANLGNFSAYRRPTTEDAYAFGSMLMAYFDGSFSGGLKPVLKEVFTKAKYTSLTSVEFQKLLESISGKDLSAYFKRYVFSGVTPSWNRPPRVVHSKSKHPRALTNQDIAAIR